MVIEMSDMKVVLPDGVEKSTIRAMVEEEKDKLVDEMCTTVCKYYPMYKHSQYGELYRDHCQFCPLSEV